MTKKSEPQLTQQDLENVDLSEAVGEKVRQQAIDFGMQMQESARGKSLMSIGLAIACFLETEPEVCKVVTSVMARDAMNAHTEQAAAGVMKATIESTADTMMGRARLIQQIMKARKDPAS